MSEVTFSRQTKVVTGVARVMGRTHALLLAKCPRSYEFVDEAVIGVPNVEMGEEVRVLIIPRDAANPPTVEELKSFCRMSLAGYKCPASYEFVTDIGRNAMGKVISATFATVIGLASNEWGNEILFHRTRGLFSTLGESLKMLCPMNMTFCFRAESVLE